MVEFVNPLRRAAMGRTTGRAGGAWLLLGLVALGAGGSLVVFGYARAAGLAMLVAAPALLLSGTAQHAKSRFIAYAAAVADAVGDAAPLTALAWPLRNGSTRIGVAAIAALGLVFLGAYAQVKSAALGYPATPVTIGAPERSLILGLGLVLAVASAVEAALWLIAVSAFFAAARTTMKVWKYSE